VAGERVADGRVVDGAAIEALALQLRDSDRREQPRERRRSGDRGVQPLARLRIVEVGGG
jgi:hypothetical protein